ncbi:unnamed protein product, partial [Ectocarpus sp. 4 AP-2014]
MQPAVYPHSTVFVSLRPPLVVSQNSTPENSPTMPATLEGNDLPSRPKIWWSPTSAATINSIDNGVRTSLGPIRRAETGVPNGAGGSGDGEGGSSSKSPAPAKETENGGARRCALPRSGASSPVRYGPLPRPDPSMRGGH